MPTTPPREPFQTLPELLLSCMQRRGIKNWGELAGALNVSAPTMSRIKRGGRPLELELAEQMIRVLQMEPAEESWLRARVASGGAASVPPAPVRPDVYRYESWRGFVRDWLLFEEMPRRSLAARARVDPGQLTVHLNDDRPMTPRFAEMLAVGLRLEEAPREFFLSLVAYNQAEDLTRKEELRRGLLVLRAHRFGVSQLDAYAFESELLPLTVANVGSIAAARGQGAAWLSEQVRPPAEVEQVQKALSLLSRLGIVQLGPDGTIAAVPPSVYTVGAAEAGAPRDTFQDHVRREALVNLHRAALQRASVDLPTAFGGGPAESEYQIAGVLALRSALPRYRELLRRWVREFAALCDDDQQADPDPATPDARAAYYLQVQLVPASAWIADAPTTSNHEEAR